MNNTLRIVSMALALPTLLAACGGGDNSSPAPYLATQDLVSVSGGSVMAAADSTASLRVFRALPFAAPPVGPLRWTAPQPVTAWSGIRSGDNFSPACLMGDRPLGRPGSILFQKTETQSEDCLYLNVWTGAPLGSSTGKRPVMVLLHGGGYQLGAGSQPNYNGRGLAGKGAVVVTLNYRLGPLGFLAHPALSAESADGTSGNYALKDAIAALQWVQRNIAQLGGDPANVTIYSESAGSGLASVLLAAPPAAGLFHKLVIGSLAALPAGAPNTTLAQAEAAGLTYASNLGAADLAALRSRTAQEIMGGAGSVVGPIVDGTVLPDQLDLLYAAGKAHNVPLLLGWNADEGTPYPPFATTLATYNTTVDARFGAMANDFRAAYPVTSDADVLAMAYAPLRDNLFAWQPWTLARTHAAKNRAATYLYFFTRRPPYYPGQNFTGQSSPDRFGAYHSLEQVYLYNNLDVSAPARPYTAVDQQLADTASSYLVNFARNGDPNGSNLPAWPRFIDDSSLAMELGDTIAPVAVPFRPALDFWDRFHTLGLGRPLPF